METKMIDLAPFCAAIDDPRGYLQKPFSFDAFTCASNGYMAIIVERRVGEPEPNTMPTTPFFSTTKKAIQKRGTETGLWLLDPHDFDLMNCPECEGTGRTRLCPECGGDSDITLSGALNDYTVECKTCENSGTVSLATFENIKHRLRHPEIYQPSRCQTCHGLGKQGKDKYYPIGDAHFQTRYLLLAKTLPNASLHAYGKADPALIVFDNGFGILMPYFPFGRD
jgi:hypothetical protein